MSTRLSLPAQDAWRRLRSSEDGRVLLADFARIRAQLLEALVAAPLDAVPPLQGQARLLAELLAEPQPKPLRSPP